VLTEAKAARLARRVADRDRGGLRGARARRAGARLRRAVAGGGEGERAAINAVWRAWLAEPDEAHWALLDAWRRRASREPERGLSMVTLGTATGPEFHGALVEAATRSGHPVARIARDAIASSEDTGLIEAVCVVAESDAGLAAFCADHGLAPADPVRRVVFFLLTGQDAQRRAADPDGTVLALGYAAAAAADRDRLRAAMADSGDIDPVQVLAADRSRVSQLPADEVSYLAVRLAGRRDWAGLWRLVLDLPLAQAIGAAALIGEGWQPASEQHRALLTRLRLDGPGVAAEFPADRLEQGTIRIEVPGQVYATALSADGRRLIAATRRGPSTVHNQGGVITVFRMPGGDPVERYEVAEVPHDARHIVDLGDGFAVTQFQWTASAASNSQLLRCSPGGVRELSRPQDTASRASIFGLARLSGRAAGGAAADSGFAALIHAGFLDFYSGDGEFLGRQLLGGGPGDPWLAGLRPGPASMAGGPTSVASGPDGRLAVAGGGLIVIDARNAPRLSLLAAAPFREPTLRDTLTRGLEVVYFYDAETLVTTNAEQGLVRWWRVIGDRIEQHGQASVSHAEHAVMIPKLGEIAVLEGQGTERRVRYLQAGSLAEATVPLELADARGACLCGSADGSAHALGGDGFVQVAYMPHPAVVVASRPLAEAQPGDLTVVRAALQDPGPAPLSRPLLELLLAALEYRFGTDVAVGAEHGAGDDDIGIA
jgi:hypothetical protein